MKTYTIIKTKERTGQEYTSTGTLKELIEGFSYTLECGKSWERDKGNVKINVNPRTIDGLIKNLNNAVNNSAANGYAGISFRLG